MNKQEETLKSALKKITPDVWDAIKKDIENEEGNDTARPEGPEKTVGDHLVLAEGKADDADMGKRSRAPMLRRFTAAAAVLVLLIGGVTGLNGYNMSKTVDSVISLDVNPSIEINTNAKDRVLSVNALNEDAKTVIGDMDFEGTDLDVAVNAILGSLLRNGYLDEYKNSILISVDNRDKNKGEAMRQRLLQEINGILEQDGIDGAVLSRVSDDDTDLEKLAGEYGISVGKAALIRDIIAGKPGYGFEDLAKLTVNELNLIADSPAVELRDLVSEGRASDKSYVGEEKAVEAALASAGFDRSQVSGLECDMDYENGVMVYEVEFVSGGVEYEYEIDAATGAVLKAKSEGTHDDEHWDGRDDHDDYDDDHWDDWHDDDDYDDEHWDGRDDHDDYDDDHWDGWYDDDDYDDDHWDDRDDHDDHDDYDDYWDD